MFEINRWEGEGGLFYDSTHREKLIRMLSQAHIRFEEDPLREDGTHNDIAVYPEDENDGVYFYFSDDGDLEAINVLYR